MNNSLEDKKAITNADIPRLLDLSEKLDPNLVRPEKVAELRKFLEGYDKAPVMYKLMRIFVYQSGKINKWDNAEAEKIIEGLATDMVNDGTLTKKQFQKIRKMAEQQTKKLML